MVEFDEIAKINGRGTSVLQGLTAYVRDGMLMPQPGGGHSVNPMPPVLGQETLQSAHVLVGNTLLVSFDPNEREQAVALADEINEALDPLRSKLKSRYLSELRKLVE